MEGHDEEWLVALPLWAVSSIPLFYLRPVKDEIHLGETHGAIPIAFFLNSLELDSSAHGKVVLNWINEELAMKDIKEDKSMWCHQLN